MARDLGADFDASSLPKITERELRARPDSPKARKVYIQRENGILPRGGHGYTHPGNPQAWILPLAEARAKIAHYGPEKRAAFLAVS